MIDTARVDFHTTSGHSERRWLPYWEIGEVQPVACISSSNNSLVLLVVLFCKRIFDEWKRLAHTLRFLWPLCNKRHPEFFQLNAYNVKLQQGCDCINSTTSSTVNMVHSKPCSWNQREKMTNNIIGLHIHALFLVNSLYVCGGNINTVWDWWTLPLTRKTAVNSWIFFLLYGLNIIDWCLLGFDLKD